MSENGKKICEELKQMRIKLAEANGIELETVECNATSPCAGTCEHCDMELRYLQEQLLNKKEEEREYPFVEIKTKRTVNAKPENSTPFMGVSIPTRRNSTNKGESC